MPASKKSTKRSGSGVETIRLTASQKAELYIKEAIYRGVLTPRERIVENDLARKIGCSRAPVREAILRIVREGLLVAMPRRGIFVREFSSEAIEEIFEIRAKLEGMCVREMRQHLTSKDQEVLLQYFRQLEIAASKNDEEQFFEADIKLHRTIWQLSRCKEVYRTLNSLLIPFVLAMVRNRSPRIPLADALQHHREYIHLILNAPAETLERAVESYFMGIYNKRFKTHSKPALTPSGTAIWLLESFHE